MASNTDYLPDEITYGFVADRVLLAVGDTASDDNRYPDGVPAQGTVRFSPQRTILYTQQRPATVLPQDIECTIYHRDHPVAKERGYEPELVGKLVDPAGHVGNVALIVGWYDVVYRLSTGTAQRFRFQVRPEHTADNPLWLPEVAPLQPTPSERFVVNEQIYNDTKAARDDAQTAATDAEAARDLVLPARDQTLAARDETLAHGITVDTSVGTRVAVGDRTIYYDSGWRNVSSLLEPDITGNVFITRQNNVVSVMVTHLRTSKTGHVTFMTLPQGFVPQPISGANWRNGTLSSDDGSVTHMVSAHGSNLRVLNFDTSSGISGYFSYVVSPTLPQILPGLPA